MHSVSDILKPSYHSPYIYRLYNWFNALGPFPLTAFFAQHTFFVMQDFWLTRHAEYLALLLCKATSFSSFYENIERQIKPTNRSILKVHMLPPSKKYIPTCIY